MALFFCALSFLYVAFVALLYAFWKKTPAFTPGSRTQPDTLVTVIVPVRNEEANIGALLEDLEAQQYPHQCLEVLVIDDESEDRTAEIVASFKASYRLKLLKLAVQGNLSHKKKAIETGIAQASGSLIFTTDGDCRVSSEWVRVFESYYVETGSKFMMGGVTFHEEKSLFEKMQTIEFAGLTGSGAASLKAGFPNMCNGANLVYKKEVFQEVSGYEGFDHIPSGDDEFLMHKIFRRYPKDVHFVKNEMAVVHTAAKQHLNDFVQQRKRWAGKWKYYTFINIKLIAFFIFVVNFAIIVAFILYLSGHCQLEILLFQVLTKAFADYLFLREVLSFYRKKMNPLIFMLTGVFYPFYASFFALTSNIGKYTWKQRRF